MHLHRIDLNLLVALDALLREGSVTRAASALHLSQSAMSHALGRLRTLTGDALFVRGARGMNPTPRAEALRAPVARVLQDIEAALGPSRFDPSTTTRTFRIGTTDYFECLVCPLLIEQMRQAAPLARVQIQAMSAIELEADLAASRSDVFVSFASAARGGRHCERVLSDSYVCVARADRFGTRSLTMARYLDARHIVVSTDGNFTSTWEPVLRGYRRERQVVMTTPRYLAAVEIVARSDLVITIQSRLAREFGRYLPVKVHRLPFTIPPVDLTMQWPERLDRDPAQQWLRGMIVAACRRLVA